jgi:polyferredoxin
MNNISRDLPVVENSAGQTKPTTRTSKRKPKKPTRWRRIVQLGFAAFNIVIGIQFYRFVHEGLETSQGMLPYRPPGVEGWLPISGLMGLVDWLHRGTLNLIHPAATVILLAIVVIAFMMRKAFCAWLCPVGMISEYLAKFGRWMLRRKRSFLLPQWLDYPLMGMKYFLLGFFLWAFMMMGSEGISSFLASPYNRVSDVKMLLFFENISTLGLSVLGILMAASVFIEGFWCRYLCPYGALLGFVSVFSPVKVRRNAETCIDCGKCNRVCPSRLPVMSRPVILSAECTGCMNCVESCPVPDTLKMGTKRRSVSTLQAGIIIVSILIVFSLGARLLSLWESNLSDEEYRTHMQNLESPEYGHPGE